MVDVTDLSKATVEEIRVYMLKLVRKLEDIIALEDEIAPFEKELAAALDGLENNAEGKVRRVHVDNVVRAWRRFKRMRDRPR